MRLDSQRYQSRTPSRQPCDPKAEADRLPSGIAEWNRGDGHWYVELAAVCRPGTHGTSEPPIGSARGLLLTRYHAVSNAYRQVAFQRERWPRMGACALVEASPAGERAQQRRASTAGRARSQASG